MKKRVWIVRTMNGNPLDTSQRPERAVRLASYLAEQGYDVTFFGTAFIHAEKKYIANNTIRTIIDNDEKVILFHVPIAYKKNISFRRILYGKEMAHALKKEIYDEEKYPRPDLIFASYPTENDCRVLVHYGAKYGIPIILDARDAWPDIFIEAIPKKFRGLGKLFVSPMQKRTAKTIGKADNLCAMSPVMLEWALNYAGRMKRENDQSVFIACDRVVLDETIREDYMQMLAKEGITEDTWNICYFSTLSRVNIDVDTVIEAMELVVKKHPQVRLIIGGRGDDEERIRQLIQDKPYVKMLGWLNQDQMATIMSLCKMSLLYTINNDTNKNAWGNRVGQYLSCGLPYITCVKGIAKQYGELNSCGIFYKEYDAKDLVEKLVEIIENPNTLQEMSLNAKRCFDKDFSTEVVMEQFKKMIDVLIKEKEGK